MSLTRIKKIKAIFYPEAVKKELSQLLSIADEKASFEERLNWFEGLMQWVRSPLSISEASTSLPAHVRIRFILQLLERHPEWKLNVSLTLQSLLRDTKSVQFFSETGLIQESGFWSQFFDIIAKRIIPQHPDHYELSEIVPQIFSESEDIEWVDRLSLETVAELLKLLNAPPELWDSFFDSIVEALIVLGGQISGFGTHTEIRKRLPQFRTNELPFIVLQRDLYLIVEQFQKEQGIDRGTMTDAFHHIAEGRAAIQSVLTHLENSGVSVSLVYMIEKIMRSLRHVEMLLNMIVLRETPEIRRMALRFLANAIQETQERSTVQNLFKSNLHLLARKIVERTGQSGEHYITQTRSEYFQMLFSGAGGGFLTVLTTLVKASISKLQGPLFIEGLLSWVNYSGSFIAMQFCHFTLATKQPSMTASALAGKLKEITQQSEIKQFIDLVVQITRSQFAAALGNVGFVIVGGVIADFFIRSLFGHPAFDSTEALYTIKSLHPFKSLTIYYAFLTGVILWASSIAGGWIENWFVYRNIPKVIEHHRYLNSVLGDKKTKRLSQWFTKHISGLAGNLSIGFLLAFIPIMGRFFGIPAEVRHITLSTGSLTFALSSIGFASEHAWDIAFAMLGIVIIGIFNFGVSFVLAMFVAARARAVPFDHLVSLFRRSLVRLRTNPASYFLPPRQ